MIPDFWARQSFNAPSTPSFWSRSWNAGRNRFMSVLALRFSRIRQITSVSAANDIRNIGMAKYQSFFTNSPNAFMEDFPNYQSDGTIRAFSLGHGQGYDALQSFVHGRNGRRQNKIVSPAWTANFSPALNPAAQTPMMETEVGSEARPRFTRLS